MPHHPTSPEVNTMTDEKPKRRTHWQALAHKRYRRMTFMGGDGEWLVMTMCPSHWQYRLFPWRDDAEAWMAEIDQKGCGNACKGKQSHRIWRLI
jgi:hypothetical protein